MSKFLDYEPVDVTTPLGEKQMQIPHSQIVLCSILRAGIPLHNGILNYFDQAENAFISGYRIQLKEPDSFKVEVDYLATPSDRKSTRLNSSHVRISYAVFCLKKKKQNTK